MIVINPMSGSNTTYVHANGIYDYNINMTFAALLASKLRARGEAVVLTRTTSEQPTTIEYNRLMTNAAPDVMLNICCLSDISGEPSGYVVECDKYTVLAATISAEMCKWGAKATYPLGYKVVPKVTVSKYTDITIGLGYITNKYDASKLADTVILETLATSIVEAAYGPPTKAMQPKDDVYTPDPYMYNSKLWVVDKESLVSGDKYNIISTTIENIPARVLHLETKGTRAKPLRVGSDIMPLVGGKSYICILSFRSLRNGSKYSVTIGSVVKEGTAVDNSWHKLIFDYVDGSTIYLGCYGDSTIEYTAVWVTPRGTLGGLDDPNTQYSIFPPGYRPLTPIDPTAVDKTLIPSIVTQANSLMGRAQDKVQTSVNAELQAVMSKVDQLPLSPKSVVAGIQGVTGQLSNINLTQVKILDAASVLRGVDYAGLENVLRNMARGDKRAALQKSINDLKGVEKAAKQLTLTQDEKFKMAKERAAIIQKRLEKKGEAMSKP